MKINTTVVSMNKDHQQLYKEIGYLVALRDVLQLILRKDFISSNHLAEAISDLRSKLAERFKETV